MQHITPCLVFQPFCLAVAGRILETAAWSLCTAVTHQLLGRLVQQESHLLLEYGRCLRGAGRHEPVDLVRGVEVALFQYPVVYSRGQLSRC